MNKKKALANEETMEKDGIQFDPLEDNIEQKESTESIKKKVNTENTESTEEKVITESKENSKDSTINNRSEESKQTGEVSDKKKRKRSMKKLGIILVVLVLLIIAGIYVTGVIHYKSHFLPNTSINNVDCSELDAAQIAGILENRLQQYTLEVMGRDYETAESGAVLGRITAVEIDLKYADNTRIAVEELLNQQNVFLWPCRLISNDSVSISLVQGISYDEALLSGVLKSWEACQKRNMKAPENAYISEYSDKLKGYEIIPETIGTEFRLEQLQELAGAAIIAQEMSLDMEAAGCYTEAAITSKDEKMGRAVSDANRMLGTEITYDWNGTEVILDAELLKEWVSIVNNKVLLDETAVSAFVNEQAESCDTYGKPRRFMTTLGIELTLPSGYYGWKTDSAAETEELLELIKAGSVEKREPVYSSTARKKGMSDIGNTYVEADLTHQHLYLYKDGKIVFETNFVSGSMSSTPDCVTPQGVFGLTYKTTNAVLRGANYETPVSYWMPFYGNYGMHDATWRSEFGGDIYITNGSHGCINLPLDAAATIYEYVSTGFPVVCYYYPVDPLAVQPEENEVTDNSEE